MRERPFSASAGTPCSCSRYSVDVRRLRLAVHSSPRRSSGNRVPSWKTSSAPAGCGENRSVQRKLLSAFGSPEALWDASPAMWRDVILSNREELLNQSRMFQRNLQSLELMITSGNSEALLEQIENASATRANWSMAKQQK